MALIAKRSFKYGNRHYAVGDEVPVRSGDRRVLRALKYVADAPPKMVLTPQESADALAAYEARMDATEAMSDEEVRAKYEASKKARAYKRRDLKAEE